MSFERKDLLKEVESSGGMNTIVDYIWCRLSEKYIKLSKAFRNMDITMVRKTRINDL